MAVENINAGVLHHLVEKKKKFKEMTREQYGGGCTSTSQRALELVAEVADWRSVALRKTCCCFL